MWRLVMIMRWWCACIIILNCAYYVRICMHNKPWLLQWGRDLKKRRYKVMYFLYVFCEWVWSTNVVRNHKCFKGRREITSWSCHPLNWRLFLSHFYFILSITIAVLWSQCFFSLIVSSCPFLSDTSLYKCINWPPHNFWS